MVVFFSGLRNWVSWMSLNRKHVSQWRNCPSFDLSFTEVRAVGPAFVDFGVHWKFDARPPPRDEGPTDCDAVKQR